jgi:ribosomal protein L24
MKPGDKVTILAEDLYGETGRIVDVDGDWCLVVVRKICYSYHKSDLRKQ